jgi:hypothetical protein
MFYSFPKTLRRDFFRRTDFLLVAGSGSSADLNGQYPFDQKVGNALAFPILFRGK